MSRTDTNDYIYYNANMVNNNTSTGGLALDPAVIFEDVRTTAVLQDVSRYELSVQSISINGALKNVPVFIPQIYIDPATGRIPDVNRTIYDVTFSWSDGFNTFSNTQIVYWSPQNLEGAVPAPNLFQQDLSGAYYYCYSYGHWCTLINTALTLAYDTVKAEATAKLGFGGTLCPYFAFNKVTKTFSIYQDSKTSIAPYGQLLSYNSGCPGIYRSQQTALAGAAFSKSTVNVAVGSQTFTTITPVSNSTGLTGGVAVKGISEVTGQTFVGTVTSFGGTGGNQLVVNVTGSTAGTGVGLAKDWSITTTAGLTAGTYFPNEYTSVGFDTNFSGLIAKLDTKYYASNNIIQGWNGVVPTYYPQNLVTVYPTNELPFLGWYSGLSFDTTGSPGLNTGALPSPLTSLMGVTASTQTFICMSEEETSVETLWSPIRSLVLTSTSIPAINEYSSAAVLAGGQNLGLQQPAAGGFDFSLVEVPLNTNSLDYFQYAPATEHYTALSLTREKLQKIQLSLYWRNRLNNQLYPVQLYNLGTVSVRLLFKMKTA